MSYERTKDRTKMVDVMDGCERWFTTVGEHGFVALIDCMPRFIPEGKSGDGAIVQAARVSYGDGTKSHSEDEGLIRYLMRHRHSTPFEMVEFKFHCAMPIFVARQWIRHRTANVNEYSARYSIVKDRFYHPSLSDIKEQSTVNKQGGVEQMKIIDAQGFLMELEHQETEAYNTYQAYIAKGMARETARIILPMNTYTEWYWKIDLHNLLHFLSLRMDSHAQKEIRDFATPMFDIIKDVVPFAAQAFLDYRLDAMTLSRLEIDGIRTIMKELANRQTVGISKISENNREQGEFIEKLRRLGL